MFDQVKDVTMCRVLGAFGERGVFRGCEFAFESVEQAVDRQPLTVVELHIIDAIPEAMRSQKRCDPRSDAIPEAMRSQKRALAKTALKVSCAPSRARPKQPRNHSIQGLTSIVPFCVHSRMS